VLEEDVSLLLSHSKLHIQTHSNYLSKQKDPSRSADMVTHVNDRVKKFRALKKSTRQGAEQIRAANRLYAERCRRKRSVKRLTQEKQEKMRLLNAAEQREINGMAAVYRSRILLTEHPNCKLSEDEQRNVDIKVLKYEGKIMKSRENGRNMTKAANESHLVELLIEPVVPLNDEITNLLMQMPIMEPIEPADTIPFGSLSDDLWGSVCDMFQNDSPFQGV